MALLHLTPGLDGVSKAANEAERGMLPAEPTICVGQPTALDPSRAPEGKAILWLQLPEAPRTIKGDAAGRDRGAGRRALDARRSAKPMPTGSRPSWPAISRDSRTPCSRARAYSPADLEAMNVNLVGGDPYGGFCGARPVLPVAARSRAAVNHRTPVPGLYHIGASTHPGPGLGGGSGFLLAKRSLNDPASDPPRPRRADVAERFSGQSCGPADRRGDAMPDLGEIGLNQFAPYLMNRISARWNGELGEDC